MQGRQARELRAKVVVGRSAIPVDSPPMAVRTIEWRNGSVVMIDQRLLPTREVYRVYRDHRDVARAIKDMVIRGAPAIGVAAAMGIALGMRSARGRSLDARFERLCTTF